jgi:hypothetical protein
MAATTDAVSADALAVPTERVLLQAPVGGGSMGTSSLANAVWRATGVCVRDLPLRLDRLVG